MTKYLIKDWRVAYKKFSVQLAALGTVLATASWLVPDINQYLPADWARILIPIIFVARLWKQTKDADKY